MASEEVAALRSINRHMAKRGDTAESLVARVRSEGDVVNFESLYRCLAKDGFRLPPDCVTLLIHTLGEDFTAHKFSAVLAMADSANSIPSEGGGGAGRRVRTAACVFACCGRLARGRHHVHCAATRFQRGLPAA